MLIQEHFVDLPTPSGPMRTHVFRPTGGTHPGIVLFSEIYQVTGPIARTARLVAGHGYIVAVPEVYHELEPAGRALAYDKEGTEAGNRHKIEKEVAAYDADARAVLDHLRSMADCNGRLGAMGMCLGGHLSFRCAMNPEVLAAACFYATDIHKGSLGKGKGKGKGMQDDSLARAPDIKGELMMIWGRQDPHIPPEGRDLIRQTLTQAAVDFTWHEFNAVHAFIRDEGPRYNPALATICYAMVLELFARRLKSGI